jgi:hypothetical protein
VGEKVPESTSSPSYAGVDGTDRNAQRSRRVVEAQSTNSNEVEGVSVVGVDLNKGESQLGQLRNGIQVSNDLVRVVLVRRADPGSGIRDKSSFL